MGENSLIVQFQSTWAGNMAVNLTFGADNEWTRYMEANVDVRVQTYNKTFQANI